MALKVIVSHKTTYTYDKPVTHFPHIFRLRPAPHSRTAIEAYSFKITPKEHFINWQQDPFGNYLARIVFHEPVKELTVAVELIADMKVINPFDFFVEDYAKIYPFTYEAAEKKELQTYLELGEEGPEFEQWVKTIDISPAEINDFLVAVNQRVYQHLNYTIRMESGVQTCETTLEKKLGSCRDFAWLLVKTLRYFGLASRFVSGYIIQLKADEKSLDGPSGPEEDFTDLHAWAEVFVPGAGWIGLDATSGLFTGEGHIPLAGTPHYQSAAPVVGATGPCEVEMSFENTIKRIFESPRVTKPYTQKQWDAIYNLGFKVDKDLEDGDVRLTMGGEPTFVSIDDMESEQWNTDADGEHKRLLATDLSRRLLEKFGKGGILHHTEGKWYPGEPLPRWEIGIYWRKDGFPIWNNTSLLDSLGEKRKVKPEMAKKFLNLLSEYLGISTQNIASVHEDIYYFLWEKENLPEDLDISSLKDLKKPSVKKKLSEIFTNGDNRPSGYLLPMDYYKGEWISNPWKVKRKKIFLTPGNSPIGLRLPLDSLLIDPEVSSLPYVEYDTFKPRKPLPKFINKPKKIGEKETKNKKPFVRTALCAEVRDKKLYLYLPPLKDTVSFLSLMTCIEATAKKLKTPVVIEGYAPPRDNRIECLKITPDPGVIEINVHPAKSWKELTDNITTLYDEAKKSRLGTEKFLLDGRHTGTGGGNHVTLGGVTPADSPLLRDPRLLRSLLTFWQNHPGLSYLFSGAFIGPTSQAPRVDEARMDSLYELEIAFEQIPKGQDVPFWLTDRLFRHLLTDITGNTHRAEFCIDKLYSPDSSSGRLGILELRAFDMPPHKEMSLMQMLLVRTLVAWFWKKPYEAKLIRWGTQLHDKFLMEHYVREDINDIVAQLNDAGYEFKTEWFNPFFEFRFPLYGLKQIKGMEFDLRMAIEPWNVLGEEMASGGTSRYVDSSLERVQLKVSNFVPERYIVTCNEIKIPLKNTGVLGEYVASVRYKAWKPHSALHPTIDVDVPLVFDVVDTWNDKSIGGFTYFVEHPGGLAYETQPVNSYEAESRRINRFWDFNHTQGDVSEKNADQSVSKVERYVVDGDTSSQSNTSFNLKEIPVNPEFPNTLDLRKK